MAATQQSVYLPNEALLSFETSSTPEALVFPGVAFCHPDTQHKPKPRANPKIKPASAI